MDRRRAGVERWAMGGRGWQMRHGVWLGLGMLAALVVLTGQAVAHGGGLDASGCHHNRKTGDYHCHRGGARLMAPVPPATKKRVRRSGTARPSGSTTPGIITPYRVRDPAALPNPPQRPSRKTGRARSSVAPGPSLPCYCGGLSGYRLKASGACVAIPEIITLCGIPPEGKCSFEGVPEAVTPSLCPKPR